jgi:hypothetical protein
VNTIVAVPITSWLTGRLLDLPLRRYLAALVPSGSAALAGVVVGWATDALIQAGGVAPAASFGPAAVFAAASFLMMIRLCRPQDLAEGRDLFRSTGLLPATAT